MFMPRRNGFGWLWDDLLQSGISVGAPASGSVSPNFVNQGDVFNFYLEVNAGTWPYTAAQTNDFRGRMAQDGMRPIAIDDSNLGSLFGGTIVGQFQAEHGYGPWSDVANRIAGMAVAAGFRVQYSGSSPRVEPFARNVAPGYSPNTVGSIYAKGNAPNNNSDGDWPNWVKDMAKMFGVSVTTFFLGGIVLYIVVTRD